MSTTEKTFESHLDDRFGPKERTDLEKRARQIAFRATLGEKLREIREARGLTIEQLAEKMGVKKWTVIKAEEGEWKIDIDMLQNFSENLQFEFVLEMI